MIIDAHLHLSQKDAEHLIQIMTEHQVYGLVAGTHPEEWKWLQKLASTTKYIFPTYGLHPWYADQYHISEIVPYLETATCIGEIGMDSIWCGVDLRQQRKIFIAQLDMAEEKGCPVILHTKGQEKEIAKIIADYTMPVLVHWYSIEDFLDLYLERDCYFTIGPDVKTNQAVQQVVKAAPLHRLFVETDGLSALEWMRGRSVEMDEIPTSLIETMIYIAEEKGVAFTKVKKQMAENLTNYMSVNKKGLNLIDEIDSQ